MKQIVACGGGGFSMEDTPWLDDYILGCARRQPPRVCFVPTASGDAPDYIAEFYRAFSEQRCVPSDLTLADAPRELADFLAGQDVIYVGGGNTAAMLAAWRAHGVDRALRAAWQRGTVLAGISAGMNCWFAASVTDSFGPLAPLHDGLGLLAASACPHYDSDPARQPSFHALVGAGELPAGYAADDGVGLHFIDDRLHAAVASRPGAAAYRVDRAAGGAVETALPTRFLGQ